MYLLDHIVHFVNKPESMVVKTKEMGLHTVEGGKHEMWGTYNSLCYFGLSYIEFIGVFDEALIEKSAQIPYTLHHSYKKRNNANGLTRIALRTTTIDKDAEQLREAGFEVIGPDSFSRVRPDGSVLTWKLLHFGKKDLLFDFPFLIQWDGTDEERYEALVNNGTIQQHPLGNLQIDEVSFEVKDLKIAEGWAEVFQFNILESAESYIKLKAPNCAFSFHKVDGKNEIVKVKIVGAKEEKEVVLEEGKYIFVR
ncbi:MAG: VOC family protein [Lysinibacillus sp.]|nr:VOC family protein [Lysinibacillus sp.]